MTDGTVVSEDPAPARLPKVRQRGLGLEIVAVLMLNQARGRAALEDH